MKLSNNFTLEEFTHSQMAIAYGIPNLPDTQQIVNLVYSAMYMQRIRDYANVPIVPSSAFRSFKLNQVLKGAENSWHMKGLAIDFVVPGYTVPEAIHFILKLDLPFMELVNEHNRWIHIAFAPIGETPRKTLKRAITRNNKTVIEVIS